MAARDLYSAGFLAEGRVKLEATQAEAPEGGEGGGALQGQCVGERGLGVEVGDP